MKLPGELSEGADLLPSSKREAGSIAASSEFIRSIIPEGIIKKYIAKTDKKGEATFKIKKLTKKGKYTASIKFQGDKYYNKVTKKVKIIVK